MDKHTAWIIGLLVVMVFSFAFTFFYKEPFPALIQPTFSQIPQVDTYTYYWVPRIKAHCQNDSTHETNYMDFVGLSNKSVTLRMAIMKRNFAAHDAGIPRVQSVIIGKLSENTGELAKTPKVIDETVNGFQIDPGTLVWFKERVRSTSGCLEPKNATVIWQLSRRSLKNNTVDNLETRTIPIEFK